MTRVSVCLPNLNTSPYLKERLESIRGQSFQYWECIVSDNFSDDGSWEIFREIANVDSRFKLKQEPRDSAGMYPNWNHCLDRASGEFVYIATSDDTMRSDFLEKTVLALDRNAKASVVVSDFDEIDCEGSPITKEDSWHRRFYGDSMQQSGLRSRLSEFVATVALGTTWFTITSVLFRRSLLERTGYFPTVFGSHGDNLWTARAALAGDVVYLPERLATFRRHETQATAKPLEPALAWKLVCGFQDLLQDVSADLPDEWTNVPGWRERLMRSRLDLFRAGLKLERWRLRQDPDGFFESLRVAWQTQPRWLLKQALAGFPSVPELDPVPPALDLVSEFLGLVGEVRFRPMSSS